MIIHIIACGTNLEKAEQVLVNKYQQRLRISLQITEISGSSFPYKSIIDYTKKRGTHILLHETGHMYSSIEFSKNLEQWYASAPLYFYIGGALGFESLKLSDLSYNSLKKSLFHHVLSFGRMTFPHTLTRILLLEQLYRASCIFSHHPYHH